MPQIVTDGDYLTLVNVFHTRPETQRRVADILVAISDEVAAPAPGFVSASTHTSADGTRVFNYLQWERIEDLQAMQATAAFNNHARHFAGLLDSFEEHPCTVLHVRSTSGQLDSPH